MIQVAVHDSWPVFDCMLTFYLPLQVPIDNHDRSEPWPTNMQPVSRWKDRALIWFSEICPSTFLAGGVRKEPAPS